MSRRTRQDADAPGHDSFLDIVANMVGILIILVMVVGVRVKSACVVTAIPGQIDRPAAELQRDLAVERSLHGDIRRVSREIENCQQEALIHGRPRDVASLAVASVQREIETRRSQMDAETRAVFDLQQGLSESRTHLDELARERLRIESTPSEPTVVQSYPTPLSRTVNGREAHYQLRGGLIVRVPVDEFVDELKSKFRQKMQKLLDRREMTETLGPMDGFRFRYTLRRHEISPEMAAELGHGRITVRLEEAEFLPVSSRMGEPVETALAAGSEFRRSLSAHDPDTCVVTVWTYEDSFAGFRRVKESLYKMGYSVAGRPLPLGVPISMSPQGTKSAAE